MTDQTQPGLPTPVVQPLGIGARILYSILFGFVFWVVCWVLAITTIVQLLLGIATGKPGAELTQFGAGLAEYARLVVRFLTCASDKPPFPFADWPKVPTHISRDDIEHL
jgi:uncharacterized membrane protein YphA (DoxX/SURF4 family)